jgi:hypothetical protein
VAANPGPKSQPPSEGLLDTGASSASATEQAVKGSLRQRCASADDSPFSAEPIEPADEDKILLLPASAPVGGDETVVSAENPSSPRLNPPPVLTSDAPLHEVDAPRDYIGAVLNDSTEVVGGEVEPSFTYRTRSSHSPFPAARTIAKKKFLQRNFPNLFLV